MFTFVVGVIYENEAYDRTLEIRKLAPQRKKEYRLVGIAFSGHFLIF